jgi:hypothetical protein
MLVVVVWLAGLIAVLVRGFTGQDPKTLRGRLRAAAWNGALLALAIVLIGALNLNPLPAAVIPAVAAGIIIFRPRWVRGAVATGLLLAGLAGFAAVRNAAFGYLQPTVYGLARVGVMDLSFYLLLPQAYLFLTSGGWIGWRTMSRGSARSRLLLGRLAEPGYAARPWALLLFPVAVIATAAVAPNLWFGSGAAGVIWPAVVLGATALFVRNSAGPRRPPPPAWWRSGWPACTWPRPTPAAAGTCR